MGSVLLPGSVWCRYNHCLLFSTFQKLYLEFGVSKISTGVDYCLLSDPSSLYRITSAYSSQILQNQPQQITRMLWKPYVQLKIRKTLSV